MVLTVPQSVKVGKVDFIESGKIGSENLGTQIEPVACIVSYTVLQWGNFK